MEASALKSISANQKAAELKGVCFDAVVFSCKAGVRSKTAATWVTERGGLDFITARTPIWDADQGHDGWQANRFPVFTVE